MTTSERKLSTGPSCSPTIIAGPKGRVYTTKFGTVTYVRRGVSLRVSQAQSKGVAPLRLQMFWIFVTWAICANFGLPMPLCSYNHTIIAGSKAEATKFVIPLRTMILFVLGKILTRRSVYSIINFLALARQHGAGTQRAIFFHHFCLSVRHVVVLCLNECAYRQTFWTV